MESEVFLREIVRQFELGEVTAQPRRGSGGFMHKMYKVETSAGVYAVKLLNPVIMKRPDAMGNFRRAERLERVLQENDIPVISALEKDGSKMQCLNGQYYYLFEWSEGKALDWHEIGEEHCRIAGKLLAGIHGIPCGEGRRDSSPELRKTLEHEGMLNEDWDSYIEQAAEMCPKIAEEMTESRELLYQAQREYNAAVKSAPDVRCICDGDMDCKNVLWEDGKPYIIDLECLDYGNPFTEMFQLALSWAGGAICELDFVRFSGFVDAYQSEYGDVPVDWKVFSGVGYSWLDWLAYNVRRSLGAECADEEERQLGVRETRETLRRIRYYHSVRGELVKWFEDRQKPAR